MAVHGASSVIQVGAWSLGCGRSLLPRAGLVLWWLLAPTAVVGAVLCRRRGTPNPLCRPQIAGRARRALEIELDSRRIMLEGVRL